MFNFITAKRAATESHTITIKGNRDFHIIDIIIEENIDRNGRSLSKDDYYAYDAKKEAYVIGFTCTAAEFENIRRITSKFMYIEQIKMEAEIN